MLLAGFFEVDHWSFPDWLTVIGFPAVGIGLYLSWKQVREIRAVAEAARAAAEAAHSAIARTEAHLAGNHLLILIPQAHQVWLQLEVAVETEARDAAFRLLSDWLRVSSELQGLLEADNRAEPELISALERGAALTGQAKNALVEQRTPLEPATREVRAQISDVIVRTSRIIGRMRAFTRDTP